MLKSFHSQTISRNVIINYPCLVSGLVKNDLGKMYEYVNQVLSTPSHHGTQEVQIHDGPYVPAPEQVVGQS